MDFNSHSNVAGTHAFLGASNYHWINYDDERLVNAFRVSEAARRGTKMHALAHQLIEMGVALPDTDETINMYVNDAILFHMKSEVVLYVSENCYGTADTIGFNRVQGVNYLQIHDLKSGRSRTSENQLYIYAAQFCLEYGFNPVDLQTELRIYQNKERWIYQAEPEKIQSIIETIKTFDRRIKTLKQEPSM